jgi:RNA polymerase sigma factor (sigma-70 family)
MSSWRTRLGRLFEDHRHQLLSVVTRRVGNRDVAADLVQDVYTRLLQAGSRGGLEDDTKVLYASARNAAIEHYRSTKRRAKALERVLPEQLGLNDVASPEMRLEARQTLSMLDRALLELSPRAREIFILHRVDGLTNGEIAKRYGISVSAVEKHLARVMRHCQAYLASCRGDD